MILPKNLKEECVTNVIVERVSNKLLYNDAMKGRPRRPLVAHSIAPSNLSEITCPGLKVAGEAGPCSPFARSCKIRDVPDSFSVATARQEAPSCTVALPAASYDPPRRPRLHQSAAVALAPLPTSCFPSRRGLKPRGAGGTIFAAIKVRVAGTLV